MARVALTCSCKALRHQHSLDLHPIWAPHPPPFHHCPLPNAPRHRLLDIGAYLASCIGFPLCGSALSMVVFAAAGQLCTASARVLLLKKRMSTQQLLAVSTLLARLGGRGAGASCLRPACSSPLHAYVGLPGWCKPCRAAGEGQRVTHRCTRPPERPQVVVVTAGLVVRAMGASGPKQQARDEVAWGVGLICASAAGYSLLGVLYEVRLLWWRSLACLPRAAAACLRSCSLALAPCLNRAGLGWEAPPTHN